MNSATAAARGLREDLGLLQFPAQPAEWCQAISTEDFRVSFRTEMLTSSEFEGIAMRTREGADIFVNERIPNDQRRRFTAAHEVGHVCLHIQTGRKPSFECTSSDINGLSSAVQRFEAEANEFASELLMPGAEIELRLKWNDLDWLLVQQVREDFDVSFEAAARRCVALSKDPCCLIIHKRGEMWVPFKSKWFDYYIPTQPFPSTLKGGLELPSGDLSDTSLWDCDFSDWGIVPKGGSGQVQLRYTSIESTEYDRVMTLLAVSESDDEDPGEVEPSF